MLFNSYEFLFLFLPVTLAGYFIIGRRSAFAAQLWLTFASLCFYAAWKPKYAWPLGVSIVVNHLIAQRLVRAPGRNRGLLITGLAFNLGLLGWFKYANFFAQNVTSATGHIFHLQKIILPLGISFFTFQAIAYLVDCHAGKVARHRFWDFCLFKSFFPQLIAGPIVHHSEVMPQFRRPEVYRFSSGAFAVGLTFFAIGLVKKVFIADCTAPMAEAFFDRSTGTMTSVFDAWAGTLSYTFQLYFDFSGYSDMAVGLAAMFGLGLPINFNSPYKAANIIEFWRRWHMTLSRFLRDYVYIPLGGNRHGEPRRYLNLFLTMLLGGFWHGANWTFVLWGAWHGILLLLNHAFKPRSPNGNPESTARFAGAKIGFTFLLVMLGWVLFRSPSIDLAGRNLLLLIGIGTKAAAAFNAGTLVQCAWLALLACICFMLPNSQQIVSRVCAALRNKSAHDISLPLLARWQWLTGAALGLGFMFLRHKSAFLYFQF